MDALNSSNKLLQTRLMQKEEVEKVRKTTLISKKGHTLCMLNDKTISSAVV